MKRIVLDNGLVVILEKRPATKKVALLVGIKVGSVNESQRLNGASHFIEHLLFKSNPERTADQIAEDLDYNGISTNAFTSHTKTYFYAKAPAEKIDKALEIIYQAAINFQFDPKEFSPERKVVLAEIENYINTPLRYSFRRFTSALFRKTPLARPIVGTADSIGNVKKEELENFKRVHYAPNNTIVVLVGKFQEKEILKKIKDTFGKLKAKDIPHPRMPKKIRNSRFSRFEERKGISQVYLYLGYQVPGFTSLDTLKLTMIEGILSDGFSSRFFKKLRKERGLGYNVGAMLRNFGAQAMFVAYVAGFEPKRFEEAKKVMLGEFNDLKTNLVGPREFEGTKTLMVSQHDDAMESIEDRGMTILETEANKIPYDFRDFTKLIKKVSQEDVRAAARKYLTDKFTLTALVPEGFKKIKMEV